MARKILAPQRRKQIIDALFQCLADAGHETVTVKDIAQKAGLHYGVIHYYFKSKDEIVAEMVDSIIANYERLLLERIRPAGTASEKIELALDFLVDEFIFNRRLNRVFYNLVQMAFQHSKVREALRRQLQAYREHIGEVVKEGIASGEFNALEDGRAVSLIVALVEGMALQWMIDPRKLDRREARELIEETIRRHLMMGVGAHVVKNPRSV